MFEAVQERPVYWDNLPYDRSVTLSRGGENRDWIMSWKRIAKEFPTIERAEAYARKLVAQRPGCPVEIRNCGARNVSWGRVAVVSRDAYGRTWTDLLNWEPLL